MKKTIIVGISGGIAACKIPQLIELLNKEYDVITVPTHSATQFISINELQKLSGKPVYQNLFKEAIDTEKILKKREVEHIALTDKANIIVVAPATANLLAKIAYGIADDYLTTVLLAATCPVILCPSMNVHMWKNPVTQENIQKLQSRGFIIIHPDSGMLACGYEGEGKLAKTTIIAKEVSRLVNKRNSLARKRILVTAGGTIEPIDAVRFITNKASGKMGAALAESLYLRGADVLFICSSTSVRPRYLISEKTFTTAEDLENILKQEIPHADAIFHTAAVSDFTIGRPLSGKVSSNETLTLELTPRKKIISLIKQWNPRIKLFGFKAAWNVSESKLVQLAKEKMTQTSADAIIANDVSKPGTGFTTDTNEVVIVTKDTIYPIAFDKKAIIAEKIIDTIFPL